MSHDDYETTWRNELNAYRPAATDADWAAMQDSLAPPPAAASAWMYWLIVPTIVAGGLWWYGSAEGQSAVTDRPVEPIGSLKLESVESLHPPLRVAAEPGASSDPDLLISRQEVRSDTPVATGAAALPPGLAPARRRPLPLAISPLPALPVKPPVSQSTKERLRDKLGRLSLRPSGQTPGTNGYYPPARIRE